MLNKFPLIIVDESVDARISASLRKEGFDIICIQETMPATADIDIIKFAVENNHREELMNAFSVLSRNKLRILRYNIYTTTLNFKFLF